MSSLLNPTWPQLCQTDIKKNWTTAPRGVQLRVRPANRVLKACPLASKTRHGPIKESSHGEASRRTGGVLAADAGDWKASGLTSAEFVTALNAGRPLPVTAGAPIGCPKGCREANLRGCWLAPNGPHRSFEETGVRRLGVSRWSSPMSGDPSKRRWSLLGRDAGGPAKG
jgi:hypothetical protein